MPWQRVSKKEAINWNEKLKGTNASFTQYPYYVSSEYNSVFSKALYIKYTHDQKDIAFAAIIEIGAYPFKVGVIDSGPVLLASGVEVSKLFFELKDFATS